MRIASPLSQYLVTVTIVYAGVPARAQSVITPERLLADYASPRRNIPEIDWTPDGSSLVFAAEARRVGTCTRNSDGGVADHGAVWIVTLDARSGRCRLVTRGRKPRVAPDGRHAAFVAGAGAETRIAIVSLDGGTPRDLTQKSAGLGDYLSDFAWAPDGSSIAYGFRPARPKPTVATAAASTVRVIGQGKPAAFTLIHRVSGAGPPVQITKSAQEVHNLALPPDGTTLAWIALDAYGRREARTARADGADERVLFDFTPEIASLRLAPAEEIRWTSSDGLKIVGILVKPLAYESGRRYPLIVDLHGGPLGGVGLAGRVLLTTPLEWQMWAANAPDECTRHVAREHVRTSARRTSHVAREWTTRSRKRD